MPAENRSADLPLGAVDLTLVPGLVGIADIWQEGREIMVMKHEANREGQDVLGELEETDGIQRPMGRVEA